LARTESRSACGYRSSSGGYCDGWKIIQ
jgi:hypothetical protein